MARVYTCDRCGKIIDKRKPYISLEISQRTFCEAILPCNTESYDLCEDCIRGIREYLSSVDLVVDRALVPKKKKEAADETDNNNPGI